MGEHLFGQLDPIVIRMSSAFAGGAGDTGQEMCGALSGGVMLIGALHGRTSAQGNDDHCMQLVAAYRERFVRAFGAARCNDLKALGFGSQGTTSCAALVECAARLLLEVLETPTPGERE